MRESEAALRQLVDERDEAEREKWTILRHAHDEAERCLDLTNQLGVRDVEIGRLREEVNQVRPLCFSLRQNATKTPSKTFRLSVRCSILVLIAQGNFC